MFSEVKWRCQKFFGIKENVRRLKGVKILEYIYDAYTHNPSPDYISWESLKSTVFILVIRNSLVMEALTSLEQDSSLLDGINGARE